MENVLSSENAPGNGPRGAGSTPACHQTLKAVGTGLHSLPESGSGGARAEARVILGFLPLGLLGLSMCQPFDSCHL